MAQIKLDIDNVDRRILTILRDDGRISWVQLSERVNLSPSACQRRVEAMQASGLIKRFSVDLDGDRLGLTVQAFISVKVERQNIGTAEGFRDKVTHYPEVMGFYKLSGNIDYLIHLRVRDIPALSEFIDRRLLALDGVVDASSSIVLEDLPARFEL